MEISNNTAKSRKMQKDDILIYVDSGSTLNIAGKKRLIEYFESLSKSTESILLFRIPGLEEPGLIEKNWTSKEIFNYFESKIINKLLIHINIWVEFCW